MNDDTKRDDNGGEIEDLAPSAETETESVTGGSGHGGTTWGGRPLRN
jgi:hypothetical protein